MRRKTAFRLVREELDRAQSQNGPMASAHEGYAVIKEEVDELWTEVKAGNGTTDRGVSEAVQTAAMALRYLIDLCDDPAAAEHDKKVERYFRETVKPDFVRTTPTYGSSSSGIGGYSG